MTRLEGYPLWDARRDAVREAISVMLDNMGAPRKVRIGSGRLAAAASMRLAAVQRVGRYLAPFRVTTCGRGYDVTYFRGQFTCESSADDVRVQAGAR